MLALQVLLSGQTCLASYDAHEPFERQDVEQRQHYIDRFRSVLPPFLISVFEPPYQLLDCARAREPLIVSPSYLYNTHNINNNPDSASKAA